MPTYKLIVEYEGTAYAGWQFQPDHPTIQACFEAVLSHLTHTRVPVIAAGRTDAGVHATYQVVHFRSDKPLAAQEWMRAFNGLLPKDIGVKHIEIVPETFHARYSALAKTYEYRIWNNPCRPVLQRNRVWHIPHTLDLSQMRAAAAYLIGRHDFVSFQGSNSDTTNTVCHIHHLMIHQDKQEIAIVVEADRFLKQMVRALVGTLVEVGRMKRHPSSIPDILKAKDRRSAGPTAPAQGLTLTAVQYEPTPGMTGL